MYGVISLWLVSGAADTRHAHNFSGSRQRRIRYEALRNDYPHVARSHRAHNFQCFFFFSFFTIYCVAALQCWHIRARQTRTHAKIQSMKMNAYICIRASRTRKRFNWKEIVCADVFFFWFFVSVVCRQPKRCYATFDPLPLFRA